ncbi:hypothetical protein LJC07_03695, partial [Christensenellaceae bacterium OttesenSCG-928-L17]|nr:hypothetical protein [Christensenellaceae bacterium OttesenSCG-928-L17]
FFEVLCPTFFQESWPPEAVSFRRIPYLTGRTMKTKYKGNSPLYKKQEQRGGKLNEETDFSACDAGDAGHSRRRVRGHPGA